jgi:hypothetical protein
MNIDYKKCYGVVHNALKTNVNDMTVFELQRLKFILSTMKNENFNDEYGTTNAFFTNLMSMIDYAIEIKNEQ